MPRPMSHQEWIQFEAAVRCYCEIQARYRAWAAQQPRDADLHARMRATLEHLALRLDALRDGDELARERTRFTPPDAFAPAQPSAAVPRP